MSLTSREHSLAGVREIPEGELNSLSGAGSDVYGPHAKVKGRGSWLLADSWQRDKHLCPTATRNSILATTWRSLEQALPRAISKERNPDNTLILS